MALYEINPNNMRGSGDFFLARAGEALGRCSLVYKHANGAWYLADADAAATMPTLGISMDRVTVAGQIVRILDKGFIGRTTWTWTTGGEIYASTTAGELTQTAPVGAGDIVQVVAMATSPQMIKFSSDMGNRGINPYAIDDVDYVIKNDSGVYRATAATRGLVDLQSASLSTLWDAIYGEVAEPTMRFGRGIFTVDDTLGIQGDNTVVRGTGEQATNFFAQNALDVNIFEWDSNAYYFNVLFEHFSIDGNRANQTALSRGIEIDINDACTPATDAEFSHVAKLTDVTIQESHGSGLFFETTTGNLNVLRVHDCRIAYNGKSTGPAESTDVQIDRMFDGFLSNNWIADVILHKSITNTAFTNNYYAGGGTRKTFQYEGSTAAFPAHGNRHNGDFFDNPVNDNNADSACLSIEDYAWNNVFSGCTFGRNGTTSTADVSPQLLLQDDVTHQRFNACTWYHPSVLTRRFTYAIEERDNADYNFYSGCISKLDRPNSGLTVYGTGYWNVGANSDVDGLRVI